MRVLLTGATGYLGSALLPRLAASGHEVMALVRCDSACEGKARLQQETGLDVEVLAGDICEPGWGLAEVPPFDVLIHAAASTKLARRPGGAVRAANFRALAPIPEIVRRGGARRVLHVSTAFVVPERDGVLREALPGPGTGSNPYESSKTAAERWLNARLDVPLEIVRPGIILPSANDRALAARSPLGPFLQAWSRIGGERLALAAKANVRLGLVTLGGTADFLCVRLDSPARHRAFWNLAERTPWTLGDLAAHLGRTRGVGVELNERRAHPLLETWSPYLMAERRWANDGARSAVPSAFAPVSLEDFAALIVPEAVPA